MDYQQTYNRNWEPVNVRNAYDMAKCALDAIEELQKSPNSKYFTDDYINYQAIFGKQGQGANIAFIGGGSGNSVLSISTLNKDSDLIKITSTSTLNINGIDISSTGIITKVSTSYIECTSTPLIINTIAASNPIISLRLNGIGIAAVQSSGFATDNLVSYSNTPYGILNFSSTGTTLTRSFSNGIGLTIHNSHSSNTSNLLNLSYNNVIRSAFTYDGSLLIKTSTNAGFALDVNGTSRFQNRVRLAVDTTYANNAAAISGGLAAGTIYTTPTGELRKVI